MLWAAEERAGGAAALSHLAGLVDACETCFQSGPWRCPWRWCTHLPPVYNCFQWFPSACDCCAALLIFNGPISPTLPAAAALQKKIDYVLQKAGAKGQLAIIGFLILTLIILVFLLLA